MSIPRIPTLILCLLKGFALFGIEANPDGFKDYTFSTIRWRGSQRLWFSTVIDTSDLTDQDIPHLRVPADTFEGKAWVNREIVVHSRVPSEDYAYTGPEKVEFFSSPPQTLVRVLDDGTRRFETDSSPVITLQLAHNTHPWLLLFTQRAEDPEELAVFPILDQKSRFPKGSVQFFNLSPHDPLFVMFGTDLKRVPSRGSVGFNPSVDTGAHIILQLADPVTHPDKPIYSNMWYHEEDRRFMILVTKKSRQRDGLDLKVIRR